MPILKDNLLTKNDNSISWNFDDEYSEMENIDQNGEDFLLDKKQLRNEYQDDFDFVNDEPDKKQYEMSVAESTTTPYYIRTFETEILYPSTNSYSTTVQLMSNEEYVDIDQNDDNENPFF